MKTFLKQILLACFLLGGATAAEFRVLEIRSYPDKWDSCAGGATIEAILPHTATAQDRWRLLGEMSVHLNRLGIRRCNSDFELRLIITNGGAQSTLLICLFGLCAFLFFGGLALVFCPAAFYGAQSEARELKRYYKRKDSQC